MIQLGGSDLNNSRGKERSQTLEWGKENSSEVLVTHGLFKLQKNLMPFLLNPWLEALRTVAYGSFKCRRSRGSLRMLGKDNSSDFFFPLF